MSTTLTIATLAPLLDRLFKQAGAANSPAVNEMSSHERERLMHSQTEYLDFYGRLKDLWLPVSRETGVLLYEFLIFALDTPAHLGGIVMRWYARG